VVCHENLVALLADGVVIELHDRSFQEVALDALRRRREHPGRKGPSCCALDRR